MKRASGICIFNTLHAGHKAGALRQRKTLAVDGGIDQVRLQLPFFCSDPVFIPII
jgi:hypothetical protein